MRKSLGMRLIEEGCSAHLCVCVCAHVSAVCVCVHVCCVCVWVHVCVLCVHVPCVHVYVCAYVFVLLRGSSGEGREGEREKEEGCTASTHGWSGSGFLMDCAIPNARRLCKQWEVQLKLHGLQFKQVNMSMSNCTKWEALQVTKALEMDELHEHICVVVHCVTQLQLCRVLARLVVAQKQAKLLPTCTSS